MHGVNPLPISHMPQIRHKYTKHDPKHSPCNRCGSEMHGVKSHSSYHFLNGGSPLVRQVIQYYCVHTQSRYRLIICPDTPAATVDQLDRAQRLRIPRLHISLPHLIIPCQKFSKVSALVSLLKKSKSVHFENLCRVPSHSCHRCRLDGTGARRKRGR
jgi:hypothetical protein